MRLVCPNCGAQYEVPDDVIPPEGRDVQCSSCGSTWFQEAVSAPVEPDEFDAVTTPDAEWSPSVEDTETLVEETAAEVEEAIAPPVTMSSEATDEALAAAVKAAVARARPDHVTQQAPAEDTEAVAEDEADAAPLADDFETALNERLEAEVEDVPSEPEIEVEPEVTAEPEVEAEPEETWEPQETAEEMPARRALDPAVTDVLREEAAFEASLREEETLESQPDLGLDEPDPQDDAAKRAQQARERMARMRGVPVDAPDMEPEVIPANSRRDLLPDIEEINSTLRATEDRAPEEQPDGRPTAGQRRAGGRKMGFALALLVIAAAVYVYTSAAQVSAAVPQAEPYISAFVNAVDQARLALDAQVTKLMLWLDKIASSAGQG